jgi:hypothetical protein
MGLRVLHSASGMAWKIFCSPVLSSATFGVGLILTEIRLKIFLGKIGTKDFDEFKIKKAENMPSNGKQLQHSQV